MDIKQRLIIITGPVGAGKSTTSQALAQALRRPDVLVAVIDLDLIYDCVRQQDGYGDPAAWVHARHGAAALANCWFSAGMATVIIEGGFFTADELNEVTASIPPTAARTFVTLHPAYEHVWARIQNDPLRGISKDPAFLQWVYTEFEQALPFLHAHSVVISTDELTIDEVVGQLISVITGAA